MSSMRASPKTESVRMPACRPESEIAGIPMLSSCMDMSATLLSSPVESKTSISRFGGDELNSFAPEIITSVEPPPADSTATGVCPALRVRAIMSAAALILSAFASELPPNFCTISIVFLQIKNEADLGLLHYIRMGLIPPLYRRL